MVKCVFLHLKDVLKTATQIMVIEKPRTLFKRAKEHLFLVISTLVTSRIVSATFVNYDENHRAYFKSYKFIACML